MCVAVPNRYPPSSLIAHRSSFIGGRRANAATRVRIVPILVGSLDQEQLTAYARILLPYLASGDKNFFVISSDFCHYGPRFQFTRLPPLTTGGTDTTTTSTITTATTTTRTRTTTTDDDTPPPLLPTHEAIEALDREGMACIEQLHLANFQAYLRRTRNTICGRNPIQLLLATIEQLWWWRSSSSSSSSQLPPSRQPSDHSHHPDPDPDHDDQDLDQASPNEPPPPRFARATFTQYVQSNRARNDRDHSVSYAAAHVRIMMDSTPP